MPNNRKPIIVVPLAGALLLGGCATYAPRPSSYSYFAVPCNTPGAIRAVPIPRAGLPSDASAAAPQAAVPPQSPESPDLVAPGGAVQGGASGCLVAVAERSPGWRGPGYYGGGYPYGYSSPYGYYGAPFRGSLGIGIGFGGHHFEGRHFDGGHVGGGHGGGHH